MRKKKKYEEREQQTIMREEQWGKSGINMVVDANKGGILIYLNYYKNFSTNKITNNIINFIL